MTPAPVAIKSGAELRKWSTFFISVILVVAAGIAAFCSLQNQVQQNVDAIKRVSFTSIKSTDLIHIEGTILSRANQRDIVALQKDVKYTADTVKKIAEKLEIL